MPSNKNSLNKTQKTNTYTVPVSVADLKSREKQLKYLKNKIKQCEESESNNLRKISKLQNEIFLSKKVHNQLKGSNNQFKKENDNLNKRYFDLSETHKSLREKVAGYIKCIDDVYTSSMNSLNEIGDLKIKAYEL
jgi:chromosome segregation ATPase